MDSFQPIKESYYNIVLVGKTGYGKSSIGNTILNRKIFQTFLKATSGTVNYQLECARFGNVKLNVIDTPGLVDTSNNTEEICANLEKIMSLCPDGFHAFIFVLQSTTRSANNELETLSHMTTFFGPSFIKVCILAFTHGDSFDMNDEAIPFDDWLKQQTGSMAKLIEDCEYRCLLFYNATRYPLYEEKRQETVSKLVQLIQQQRMKYTDDNFKNALKGRQNQLLAMTRYQPVQDISYNIVMVGKTGNGKSSTGNTILNRKVFNNVSKLTSVTVDCQMDCVKFENGTLNVIDTPGIMDTCKPSQNKTWEKLLDAMSLCPEGFHAFILVLNSTSRYTNEEIQSFSNIQSFFGPTFIKICIIAFTHGDIFDKNDENIKFDDWSKGQTGEIAKLIQDCENRCLLFYNSTKYPLYEQKRQETVSKLVQLIRYKRMLYTDKHFQKAEKERKKMIVECNLPELEPAYQKQLSLITAEIEKTSKNVKNIGLEEFEAIEEEISKLQKKIEEDDRGTNVMQGFKIRVDELHQTLISLRSSKNKGEELIKMAEYTRGIKNPQRKCNIF